MTNLQIVVDPNTIEQIFLFSFLGFLAATALTPIYTAIAFKGQWWKKARTHSVTGEAAPVYAKLHAAKHARNIPTMAGLVFVLAVALVNIRGVGGNIAGMRAKMKSLLLLGVALVGGWWLFSKLGITSIDIPFIGAIHLGWLIIPLFILVIFSTANAVNITDGLDGLAGGLAAIAFGAYAVIALIEKKYGLAGFCTTVTGALLSYTWFNVYPARFFMGDVGSFALGTALGVVAMLTDTVLLLPIIGLVFVVETGSVALQILSKKLRAGKKIFHSTPIHHHFEALGWPETKITMRFWIIGYVAAFVGLIVFVLGGPTS
jgi:phospho-N-acetylmuramoyl-pentapeptide-transferase